MVMTDRDDPFRCMAEKSEYMLEHRLVIAGSEPFPYRRIESETHPVRASSPSGS